jgi:hypothetical protein
VRGLLAGRADRMTSGFRQPEREFLERRGKKVKRKESKFAFVSFHFLFGIGTFQRVMAEKNKKSFPSAHSRLGLWSRRFFKQPQTLRARPRPGALIPSVGTYSAYF